MASTTGAAPFVHVHFAPSELQVCGIAGFTHKNWVADRDLIRRTIATLIHRGPEQQGVYESARVSLGAARLKILDLESGDQPIITDDGNIVITFNGEIYNHLELRRELQQHGHCFHSQCDTETVLHAFQEWDTDCFKRFRGMFAVALLIEAENRLVLARDRIGIKPLYVANRDGDLYFGSELKAILIHPEIERILSLAGLDCYLSLNYVPCPWTLIEGITKLEPGHWMEWRNGATHKECYWQLPPPREVRRSLDDAKEELDFLLTQAIREHLLSDVSLGVWLSGGIDSSTIVHYASAEYASRLKTFSISFKRFSFDESAYIHQVSKHYGTEHSEFDLNPDVDLAGAIEEFAYYSDEPTADAGALPVWFLSKLCKTQTTVALSGEGADELFGGYVTYRADELSRPLRNFPRWLLNSALSLAQLWPASDEKIGFDYKLKRFFEGCLLPPEQAHLYWNGTFSEEQKQSLVATPLPGSFDKLIGQLAHVLNLTDNLAPFIWFDQKYYLPDDILVKTDRMSMAHAVEVRPPFLDHRIVEFAASLPVDWKVRGSRQKCILKALMNDKLPPAILKRSKVGFDIPAHDWMRGPLRTLLIDTLHTGMSDHPEFLRASVVEEHLYNHLKKKTNVGYHLWGLLILLLWMKRWRVSLPRTVQFQQDIRTQLRKLA